MVRARKTVGLPSTIERQTELRMLTDESIHAMLQERKIELISWGEL
jgi:predicted glycoside hydrolase/deacetylase ChbG (UPF0249 family)